jgi:hypothetical protein
MYSKMYTEQRTRTALLSSEVVAIPLVLLADGSLVAVILP